MLKLISSFKSFAMLGMVLGGLLTLQSSTSAPQNAPISVPDVMFYGTASEDGEVLESGIVKAILPRGGEVTTTVEPINETDYNFALSIPLDVFDDPGTAVLPVDSAVSNDTLSFMINDAQAHFKNANNQNTRSFTIPAMAMGQTFILDLMIYNLDGYPMGDVNGSGFRDSADALLILRYTAGIVTGDDYFPPITGKPYLPLCDIIADGLCWDDDAERVLQCDAGLPCVPVPAPRDPLTRSNDAPLEFRLHVKSASGNGDDNTRTVQVIADDDAGQLGAATLELHYDLTDIMITDCVTDPLAAMSAAECYITATSGKVRLNGVVINGAGPDTVLAEFTVSPVNNNDLKNLDQRIGLDVYGAYDLDGIPLTWTKPLPFKVYVPLVIRGVE